MNRPHSIQCLRVIPLKGESLKSGFVTLNTRAADGAMVSSEREGLTSIRAMTGMAARN